MNRKNLKTSIVNGKCEGIFILPDTLATGYYKIKAFTNWMRNFDNDLFYSSNIFIVKQFEVNRIDKINKPYNLTNKVLFFPEGGKLVSNIESKIACKISDDFIPFNNSITITDDLGNNITNVSFDRNGLGSFTLNPQTNKTYYAKIKGKNNHIKTYTLPEIEQAGFVLIVDNNNSETISINILSEHNAPLSQLNHRLAIYSKGSVIIDSLVNINNSANIIKIPRKKFPFGISQILLFEQDSILLNERFIFNRARTGPKIVAHTNKSYYKTGEDVTLIIETKNVINSNNSNLSVSVSENANINPAAVPVNSYFNFNSEFSDFAGFHINIDSLTDSEIDNILLSANPSKYYWKDIFNKEFRCKYLLENKGSVKLIMN